MSNLDADGKRAILERHVDHLLGQLYHQLELIQAYQAEISALREQLARLEGYPVELNRAQRAIEELRIAQTGQKEVEINLRRRLGELEAEDRGKAAHIEHLTADLNRIWQSPSRRAVRAIRRVLGLGSRGGSGPEGGDGSS